MDGARHADSFDRAHGGARRSRRADARSTGVPSEGLTLHETRVQRRSAYLSLLVVVGLAAAAAAASQLLRWGEGGVYWLGPTLPWAYFISATFVGWILGSSRVLQEADGDRWRSRTLATVYVAIGSAAIVNLVLSILFFYPDGTARSVHAMLMNERIAATLFGALIYLVPLAVALPTALFLVVRDSYKARTVGIVAVIAFTLTLVVVELFLEYAVRFLQA